MPSATHGRNVRLGAGVSLSPFEVLWGFFRMSSVIVYRKVDRSIAKVV